MVVSITTTTLVLHRIECITINFIVIEVELKVRVLGLSDVCTGASKLSSRCRQVGVATYTKLTNSDNVIFRLLLLLHL